MQRIDDDTIQMTQQEADQLAQCIYTLLQQLWEDYRVNSLTIRSEKEGMQFMDAHAYELMSQLTRI